MLLESGVLLCSIALMGVGKNREVMFPLYLSPKWFMFSLIYFHVKVVLLWNKQGGRLIFG
jgi:hypothetical protein